MTSDAGGSTPAAPDTAPLWRRALAFATDILLLTVPFAAAELGRIEQLLATFVAWHVVFRSRTPGRALFRVVVVRYDGADLGVLRAGLRAAASLLSALPAGLGYLIALFGERRTLHDRITGTRVVRAPAGTVLSRGRMVVALLAFFLATALIGDSGQTPTEAFEALPTAGIHPRSLPDGKLAMSAYMLTGGIVPDDGWRTALRRMRAMGVQLVEIGQIAWKDTESEPGRYDWGHAAKILAINAEERLGLEFAADIGMFINPGLDSKERLPPHLAGRAFDDPAVIDALASLYVSFLRLPGADRVTYLLQHFENADGTLEGRPGDVPRVQRLLRETFSRAKQLRPDLLTGVCVQSYSKPHYSAELIRRWNIDVGTDVVPVISFGPTDFEVEGDVSRTATELARLLEWTGGRPLALNETGHHSHRSASSSPEVQAAYVRELFAALRRDHRRIAFATWYEYSDLERLPRFLLGLYLSGVGGMPFLSGYFSANMGSCGLLTEDGLAKPAARAWCEEARRYYEHRAP